MAKKYDLIVVGAGPAGLLAAKAAGENGLEVALLERKADPAKLTRACAQTLTALNQQWLGTLVRYNSRDKRICFPSDGFSFKYDGPYENLYSLRVYAPSGHKIDFGDYEQQKRQGDYGRVGLAFDKEALFRCLLEQVRMCSVNTFPGVNVEMVTTTADGIRVEGSGRSFEGSYVIAADGVNSRIAEDMGFNKDRTYYCNVYAMTYYMSGLELQEPHDMMIRVSTILEEGDASLYIAPRPAKGEHNILVLSLHPEVNLEIALDYFMNKAFCATWFKKAKKLKVLSAVINLYSPMIEPYRDRVLVAGDVGSLVDLENHGAMLSGWKAGQAISTAIQEANLELEITGISKYVNWWKEAYINAYNHDDLIKGFALSYILNKNDEIDYLYGLIKETLPAVWSPEGAGKAMRPALARAMPIIERERPDIFKKLQRRGLPATEVLAELTNISKPVS
jgi:flavin-dependent dehydrogenase